MHRWQREEVTIRLLPAPTNAGIVFRIGSTAIPARIAHVDARKSQLCTQLTANDHSVSTAEHLMAALVATRITNAFVDFEGDCRDGSDSVELPVLDGSSAMYMERIRQVGVEDQDAEFKYLRIKRPVQVLKQDKAAWLLPMPEDLSSSPGNFQAPTLQMNVQVNFEHKQLGTTFCRFTLGGGDPDFTLDEFYREIAAARTFTFEDEIEWMQANGLARGGSLDNAVVFSKDKQGTVLNRDGLRFSDEWTRHKMLDCIGDIGLAGLPLHGYFFATSPGHALTHDLLRELFKDPENYEQVAPNSVNV
ncbi:hypothetical protein BBO99_00009489 [Phytophthora kernoviae]|uniref:UDP-3-O-acyl-N-acetylglucosamine deacetylase n=1 Tax=Phytophthora kernoviae TaxID=325452 RepID=A0A3R7GSI6_9STRA|nr:hypothetical protein BBO99_00009489 [Phytophthora kernoviae]